LVSPNAHDLTSNLKALSLMLQLQPADLSQWFATHEGQRPVVLDVREPHEFETASPAEDPAFDLIRMPMRGVPARLDELDKTQPIACLCHHGARSAQVAMYLENMGYLHVANISGGIDAWATQLEPTLARY